MNFILVPLHTETLGTEKYSDNTVFYVYAAFFNVVLTYGMETAFFRFFSKQEDNGKVYATTFLSLTVTTLIFFALVWALSEPLASFVGLKPLYFRLLIGVVALDTLVVAPFAYLRATNRPTKFATIKILNIITYVALNFFFLWAIPALSIDFPSYDPSDLVVYIFIANLAASIITFFLLSPYFLKLEEGFSLAILKQLLSYGWPIMVAGLAFVVNENLDKLLLKDLIDEDTMGAYAGCYKLAIFMTLFIQAFRLGAEPFFFNHAADNNAKQTYAAILKYFVIVGASGLLFIVIYIDFFKELIIRDEAYWRTLEIVPVVLLANLCLGIYHNLSIWYKLTDQTHYGMYISIFGAMVTIAFNLWMIPIIGFMASAWATLAAYGGMMFVSYFLGRKHYPVPYETKKILGYLSLVVIFSFSSFYFLREQFIPNTLLLFVFLGIAFLIERKELKRILIR